MNRTTLAAIAILVLVGVGGYLFIIQEDADPEAKPAAGAVAEIPEAVQKAIDFCKEKGGSVETTTGAEGVMHLCVTGDGTKTEVGQFQAANKTD